MNFTKNMHKLILIWGRANCFIHKKQAKLHFKKILLRPQRHLCLSKKTTLSKLIERRLPLQRPAFVSRPGKKCFLIFFFNFSIIAIFHIKFTTHAPVHRHAIKELNGINFSYTYIRNVFFNFRFVNSLSSRSDK